MKQIFHNALSIHEPTPGTFTPSRFTDEQLAFYTTLGEHTAARAANTAGITLEFSSDAPTISFSYHCDHFTRSQNSIDIWQDGRLTQSIPVTPDHPSGTASYEPQSHAPIQVLLPTMARATLSNLKLGAHTPTPQPQRQAIFFGDSITQGMTSTTASNNLTHLLARALAAQQTPTAILNQGVGGFTYDSSSLLFHEAPHADLIVIAYGTNDFTRFGHSPEAISAADRYFARIRQFYPETPTYVITPLWRADHADSPEFAEFCQALARQAEPHRFHVIDGFDMIDPSRDYFADDIHPNDAGFAQFAKRLLPLLT